MAAKGVPDSPFTNSSIRARFPAVAAPGEVAVAEKSNLSLGEEAYDSNSKDVRDRGAGRGSRNTAGVGSALIGDAPTAQGSFATAGIDRPVVQGMYGSEPDSRRALGVPVL
jgi:hypothetical protein